MQTPYARTLFNATGIAAVASKTYEILYNNADVENANSPEGWWCHFAGETTGAGTLDASLANEMPPEAGVTYEVDAAVPIANMTQVTAAGPANRQASDEYCEVIAGRVKVTVTPSAPGVAGKATIVLMANRPFSIREIVP